MKYQNFFPLAIFVVEIGPYSLINVIFIIDLFFNIIIYMHKSTMIDLAMYKVITTIIVITSKLGFIMHT